MKKQFGLCLVVVTMSISFAVQAQQSWTAVSPLNQGRDSSAAATGSDGFVYVVGGGQQSQCLSSVEKYDPAGNYWSTSAPMSVPRCYPGVVFSPDGNIYVVGGNIGNASTNLVERYDTRTGAWQTVAPLNQKRGSPAVAVGPDLRLYVMGGFDSPSSTAVTSVEMFDGLTWTTLPINTGLPSPVSAITGLDGNVYAFTEVPALWTLFDGVNWMPQGAVNPASNGSYATATGPDGLMYLLGVGTGSVLSGSDRVVAYDLAGNSLFVPNMLRSRGANGAAAAVDGKILIAGGYSKSSGIMNAVETYGPLHAPVFPNARAWWTFNVPSGNAAGDSIGSSIGTVFNGALYTSGRVGKAIALNGKNQYVKVPDSPAVNFDDGDFTIEGWIRWSPAAGTYNGVTTILDKRSGFIGALRGYELFIYRGRLGVQLANGPVYRNVAEPTASIRPNQWTHIAVTIDRANNSGSFYVDSLRTGGFAPLPGNVTSSAPLLIGRNSLDASLYRGTIDELTLYDRALRWAEIRAVFLAGREGKQ